MMAFQTVFKRYELKYLLTRAQKALILQEIEPYMCPDGYGKSTIRNIYFDTDTYRLARRSLEHPDYKEKLRMRSYSLAQSTSTVFVELKKKYEGVVYKRRLSLPQQQALAWLCEGAVPPPDTQIGAEIDYFLRFYGSLQPKIFLSYEREAFYARNGTDFRVTFDQSILARTQALSLACPPSGTPLLPSDTVLMELKCGGGMPLWMARLLSRERIYKTSFSKYGTAYQRLVLPQIFSQKECTCYV